MAWSCFHYVRQVRESDLRPTERLVLTMIAHRADKYTGVWYGGIRVICSDTGLARSTVVTMVDRLAETPHLDVEKRHGRTHVYRSVCETPPVQLSDGLPVRPPDPSDCRQVRPPDQGGPTTGPAPVRPPDQGGPTTGPNPPTYPPNDPPRAAEGATTVQDSTAGHICEGCDDVKVSAPGELCPGCIVAERPAGSGGGATESPRSFRQTSDQECGPPAPAAAFARPDPSPEIAARIRTHRIFARLNADHLAETNAHHVETGGKKLEWVLAAIDSCAADADAAESTPAEEGERWSEGHKARMISRYIRKASARDVPDDVERGANGIPVVFESPCRMPPRPPLDRPL
jgi:hypothetical protein